MGSIFEEFFCKKYLPALAQNVFGQRLVGQRHFSAIVCRKLCSGSIVGYDSGGSGRPDLSLATSMPKASSLLSRVFVCERHACLLRLWWYCCFSSSSSKR